MHLLQYEPAPKRAGYPALRNPRYASLDMWRGLACVMILLLHAGFYAKVGASAADAAHHPLATRILGIFGQMAIGVPMFFVISGYCISATVESTLRKSHAPSSYFKRRLRRIFPPYWAALVLTIVSFAIASAYFTTKAPVSGQNTLDIIHPTSLSPSQWFGNATLTETWRHHILGSSENEIITPAWTLCYEEQFYAVCGLVLLLMPRRFFTGALAVSVLVALLFVASIKSPSLYCTGFFFDGKWLMFAAGVLVYYYLNYSPIGGRWLIPALMLVAIVILKKAFSKLSPHVSEAMSDQIYWTYIAVAFALLITLLRPFDQQMARSRLLAPLALCGQMCYSLYLVQWPVSKVLGAALYHAGVKGNLQVLTITVPVIVVVSIGLSWVFYHFIERHFLNSRQGGQSPLRTEPMTSEAAPALSRVTDAALN